MRRKYDTNMDSSLYPQRDEYPDVDTDEDEKYTSESVVKMLRRYLLVTLFLVLIWLMFFHFGKIEKVNSISVFPAVNQGDYVYMDTLTPALFTLKRGQLVCFHYEGEDGSPKTAYARVAGLPGEDIQIKNKKLFIGGMQYTEGEWAVRELTAGYARTAIKVPSDSYFLISENDNGVDSRSLDDADLPVIGTVPKNAIHGILRLKVYPFESIGVIE